MDSPSLDGHGNGLERSNTDRLVLSRFAGGVARASARARAACQLCRWKKVRCDARDGKRCSNCVFEELECVMLPKRPRK